MPKKIILFFESTGNGEVQSHTDFNPNNSYTNPLRLFLQAGGSLDLNKFTGVKGSDQICLFVNGVAGDSDTFAPFKKLNFALGILKFQIDLMFKRLESVYEVGDKLYVVAFSRGSSSARTFVSELEEKGLKTKTGEKVEAPPIEILICCDTVSVQLGSDFFNTVRYALSGQIENSSCVGEKGGKLPSIVKKAVHNLSMDDNRMTTHIFDKVIAFPPIFMDSADERVHEVWFPGTHPDVGGGCAIHGISDVVGLYMKGFLEEEGIVFYKPEDVPPENLIIPDSVEGADKVTVTVKDIEFAPDFAAYDHIGEGNRPKANARPVCTVTKNNIWKEGVVRIHESVLEHLKGEKFKYDINMNILNINKCKGDFVVVGSLNKVDEEKTKELKELLEKLEDKQEFLDNLDKYRWCMPS